jgi:hypothetical protein
MTARKKADSKPETQVIKVWKAPKGTEAKYITVTESGVMLQAWGTLAEIRAYYDHAIQTGGAVLIRELEKTYKPKSR